MLQALSLFRKFQHLSNHSVALSLISTNDIDRSNGALRKFTISKVELLRHRRLTIIIVTEVTTSTEIVHVVSLACQGSPKYLELM